MLIATWNVNSIRTRLPQIIDWIKQYNPDVLCLQETKVIDESFPVQPFKNLGYTAEIYGQKSYNGVAIISKIKVENIKKGFGDLKYSGQDIGIFQEQKRLISGEINGIQVINVYIPNGSSIDSDKFEYKIKWLNYLASFLKEQERNGQLICLLGDFNIAPTSLDLHNPEKYEGGIMASDMERNALKNVLNEDYVDSFRIFEKNTGHWSWWDYRNNAFESNKGWRIDHIFISKELSTKLKSCVIDSVPRGNIRPSDHVPVMINLEMNNLDMDFFEDEDDFFEI